MTQFIDKVKDVLDIPKTTYVDIRSYIRNRFITKSHAVITSLEKGTWHECETLMLHSNFQILVDYVEGQCAWLHVIGNRAREKQFNFPSKWWGPLYFIKRSFWTSREAGIARLLSEAETMDQYTTPNGGQYAREQLELYLWWKDVYPHRPDPYDLYKWSDYTKIGALEKQYADEEEANLIRLIKIRNKMWT